MVVRKPAHRFLDELEIEYDDYVVIKHPALFTSTGVTGEEHRDDREHAGDEGNGHERPAEDAIVKLTREIVPGMIVTGMEVSEMDGSLRMGQTSISGQKAAHLALRALGLPNSLGEQVKSGSTGIHSVSINWGSILTRSAVPFFLRRVNHAFVIRTSTKVDISGVNVENRKEKKKKKKEIPAETKDGQNVVDEHLLSQFQV